MCQDALDRQAMRELPDMRRYREVLGRQESHNLRNREGKTLQSHSGVRSSSNESQVASCFQQLPTTKHTWISHPNSGSLLTKDQGHQNSPGKED